MADLKRHRRCRTCYYEIVRKLKTLQKIHLQYVHRKGRFEYVQSSLGVSEVGWETGNQGKSGKMGTQIQPKILPDGERSSTHR